MPTDREILDALLSDEEKKVLAAFLDSLSEIRDSIVLREVVERLERGDINGALEAMHLDVEAFARFERAIAEAYDGAGQATVNNLPRTTDPNGNRIVFRWGVRNLWAEEWLRNHSSTLVTRIVDDQRTSIRTALSEGLARGDNPRRTALDIVGRVERTSNRRTGGIIGLTSAQERYVANARAELLSGDEVALRHYLTRTRRDRRFDRTIEKAIREGKPLDQETVNRLVGRYSDRLLELRGEMLARSETLGALNRGRYEAIRQQIVSGKIDVRDVTKTWRSAGDDRVRHTHRAMNGQKQGFEGKFQSPSGAFLAYPGDPAGGPGETIGCRCWMDVRISFIGRLARERTAA